MAGLSKVRAGAASALAISVLLGCASAAHAQRAPSVGAGTPWGATGIQLYDFNNYLTNGAGEITCPAPPAAPTVNCVAPPAPTTSAGRLERVLAWLQTKDIRNVELYSYPGNPFPTATAGSTGNLAGLQALRALGDKYGIRFPGRHGNFLPESNWDNQIAASRIVGQTHLGESGLPNNTNGYNTWDRLLATTQQLNRLGKQSVEAGLGPAYFHNHNDEFSRRYTEAGASCPTTSTDPACKSAWELVMDRTDPRWVVAQIDIGWAVCGSAFGTPPNAAAGMAYVTAMINKFTNRIVSYHFKDVDLASIRLACGDADQREIGKGGIDFAPMLAAAKNRSKYYYMERDPVAIGGPTNFNPFTNIDNALKAMRADPAPTLYAYPPVIPSQPAGTVASAANSVPVVVTNDGDAPLTITNITVQAEANDGGATTAADFAIVSQNCFGTGNVGPLAPRQLAVVDDPATADVNEAKPAAPSGTCTVNVAFKPTRTNYTSVARLQFTSNSDDAVERVLLAAKSTGDALATVGGNVPTMLALGLPTQPGSFGTFAPTVSRSYDTAVAATVTSTAGDALLSVTDPSTTATGHLVNGAFSLPSALTVRAINATNPTQAYAALSGTPSTPTNLLTYTGPVNTDAVTLGFRQAIGATDVLRSGNYAKTLTFTLSTTAP
jgi:sugar phosphate isomerase/epimerase